MRISTLPMVRCDLLMRLKSVVLGRDRERRIGLQMHGSLAEAGP